MKKQKDIYRAANKVRATKAWTIVIGVILLAVGVFMAVNDNSGGFSLVGVALVLFLLGGLIEGFAEVVEAACKLNNPDFRIDDSEVQ